MGMDGNARYKTVAGFGVVNILAGALILLCGILIIVFNSLVAATYSGIWSGLWLLVTGFLGLFGGIRRSKGLIVAFMVLSILFCVLLWGGVFWWSFVGYIADMTYSSDQAVSELPENERILCMEGTTQTDLLDKRYACSNEKAAAVNLVLLLVGGLMLIFGILSASFACCAVCACCGAQRPNGIQPGTMPVQQGYTQPGYGQPFPVYNGAQPGYGQLYGY